MSEKRCFIAVTSRHYHKDVNIIKKLLDKYKVKPFVAVDKPMPNQPFFDKKIANNIMKADFCVVILNPDRDNRGIFRPNRNVYFEYGFMYALKKEIIPIIKKKKGFRPGSDISHLDITFYNDKNLEIEFERSLNSLLQKIKRYYTQPIVFDPINLHDYNGRLLRAENQKEVYIIDEGKRRHICHENYMSHEDWSRVEIWSGDQLSKFDTGSAIHDRKTVKTILKKYHSNVVHRLYRDDFKYWSVS
jgi:hypothetical protein